MNFELNSLNSVGDYVYLIVGFAVTVASYRRSRCLSGYPIWRSVLIGVLSGSWIGIWLITSAVNRRRIMAEWDDYRTLHRASPTSAF